MPGRDLIHDIDFNALYREQAHRSSFGQRSAAHWDSRAERRQQDLRSDYTRAFLKHVNLKGAKTALDIGCGVGNLALPLSLRLKKVYALDFSPEMLRRLAANARDAGATNIRQFQLSWSDSWQRVPVADIAICSRALSGRNPKRALEKMQQHARLRCYLSVHAGGSYLGPDIMKQLGRAIEPRPDYIYIVNILFQMGIRARVDFLKSEGGMTYHSVDAFLESIRWRIGKLSAAEEKRLRLFYRKLPRNRQGMAKYRHDFEWALLSWET